MPRPIRAAIDLDALSHNFHLIRQKTDPAARIWAVVKANAYGHGLTTVVETLTDADGFALIEIDQALYLRQAGLQKPLLMLEGFFDESDCLAMIEHHLIPVITQFWQIELLEKCLNGQQTEVYIKYNSGMNRLGFDRNTIDEAIDRIGHLNCPMTLMTHFANADNAIGITIPMTHIEALQERYSLDSYCLANSAAIFRYPQTHGSWVRPGISLYGSSPFRELSANELGLKPVMTLSADIIAIQCLTAGDSVGYGSLFVADRPMRIGVVACGYGDGYPRVLSTGTPVIINGKPSQLIGRVSMDMLCVDLTDHPDAEVGTTVTLWGKDLPADDIAQRANTISYELFCQITRRVPYHYYRHGIRTA